MIRGTIPVFPRILPANSTSLIRRVDRNHAKARQNSNRLTVQSLIANWLQTRRIGLCSRTNTDKAAQQPRTRQKNTISENKIKTAAFTTNKTVIGTSRSRLWGGYTHFTSPPLNYRIKTDVKIRFNRENWDMRTLAVFGRLRHSWSPTLKIYRIKAESKATCKRSSLSGFQSIVWKYFSLSSPKKRHVKWLSRSSLKAEVKGP